MGSLRAKPGAVRASLFAGGNWAGLAARGASGRELVQPWVLQPRSFGSGPWQPGSGLGGRGPFPSLLSLFFPKQTFLPKLEIVY